jgi:N-methylhydantoinase B
VARPDTVDGATVEVIRRYLIAAAEEMRATLVRTSFSPIIYEVLDFGLSIYDRSCELVAEAPGVTRFVGANDYAIRQGVKRVGVENLAAGDVVVLNYPYWNGAHVSDATLFAPVFDPGGERPFAYLCVRAHWLDLGAKDAGYVLDSTDMHQEGLILPGTKVVRGGALSHELVELIRFNSRAPEIVIGDLHAQIAALRTGERRLLELVERFGLDTIEAATRRVLDHGERSTRRALTALPQGSWSAVDYVDDDGVSDEPVRMEVRVTNRGGGMEIDFAGSAGATRGPINLPFGSTLATCKMALKGLTSPTEPANGGQTRPLVVKAAPGTLFHAVYPAPTFTLWTGIVALELIFKALARGMPDRLAASSGGEVPGYMMVGIHPDTGSLYALSNGEQVGWGGTSDHDGMDGANHLCQTVVRNTPIEVLEALTAMFVERLELRTDSGGPGRHRGGAGVRRDIRFVGDGDFLTVAKKTRSAPWALEGGLEPEPNTLIVFPGTQRERRVSTRRTSVRAGERVTVLAAGGGGHGDPRERNPGLVLEDVLDGYVSAEAAQTLYGVKAPPSAGGNSR